MSSYKAVTALERGEEFVSAYKSEGGRNPYHNRVRIFVQK